MFACNGAGGAISSPSAERYNQHAQLRTLPKPVRSLPRRGTCGKPQKSAVRAIAPGGRAFAFRRYPCIEPSTRTSRP